MSFRTGLMAALAAAAIAAPASAAVTTYAFTTSQTTTFTIAGATFSSPDGSYGGGDVSSIYSTLSGISLVNFAATPAELDITFANPIVGPLSFNFGLTDLFGAGDTLTVTPNVGAPVVASTTLPGADFFPQGSVSFDATGVTSVRITSLDTIAIDNLTIGSSVPEPAAMAVLGAGLLGLAAVRRRA